MEAITDTCPGLTITRGLWGARALVSGSLTREKIAHMASMGVLEVDLGPGSGFGFSGEGGEHLAALHGLLWLRVYRVRDLNFLPEMPMLRFLSVTGRTNFPALSPDMRLEQCIFDEWDRSITNVFACAGIRRLALWKFPMADLSVFEGLRGLETLRLTSASIRSLSGLPASDSLKGLSLNLCRKLSSLEGIEMYRGLESLSLDSCKNVESIEPVGNLAHIKRLLLIGCGSIKSIAFLSASTQLMQVMLTGGTRVLDGKVQFLRGLPRLSYVAFDRFNAYDAKEEEFSRSRAHSPPPDWLRFFYSETFSWSFEEFQRFASEAREHGFPLDLQIN